MTARSSLTAFAVAVAGIAVFSVMDMVMKGLSLALGAWPTLLWRGVFGIVLAAGPYFATRKGWPTWPALRLHVTRGLLMAPMSFLFFYGLARTPMAQAVALTFIAPLLALGLAGLLLKESIGPRMLAGSLLALAGGGGLVVGQARADLGHEALVGSLAVLASATIYAFNIIVMRAQAQRAGPAEIAFFQALVIGSLFFATTPFLGLPPLPRGHWHELLLASSLALVSMWLLAWAYARAGAGYLSNTEYTSFLWAILLGWWRFGEGVSPFTLAGAALIVAGCFLAARAERPVLEAIA
ncbi:DMT family transporter [Sphingomonas sp. ASV193]|uniref:DMT family transporter n=1 Tax=Sphingomonas sp. ASV193 TaxID=3144405 RepID=UPI0032E8F9B6